MPAFITFQLLIGYIQGRKEIILKRMNYEFLHFSHKNNSDLILRLSLYFST